MLHRTSLATLITLAMWAPNLAWAQSATAQPLESSGSHWIELLAEIGLAGPMDSDYSQPQNESIGTNVVGSALIHWGYGLSTGLAVEWTHMPWTTRTGSAGHFDTVVIGPEVRFTVNRNGRVMPHLYGGLGLGSLSSSPPLDGINGGPAIRGGIGVDYRLNRRFRLGISVGLTWMGISTQVSNPQEPVGYVSQGEPSDPGYVWSLRLGGRGEFL
jgi:hypothetical protein